MKFKNHRYAFPENLYCDIFRVTSYKNLPKNAEASAMSAINMLPQRIRCVIAGRYVHKMSLRECIENCGESPEQMHSRETQGLNLLRCDRVKAGLKAGEVFCEGSRSLADIELSYRAIKGLFSVGILTVGDYMAAGMDMKTLVDIKRIGKRTAAEIVARTTECQGG